MNYKIIAIVIFAIIFIFAVMSCQGKKTFEYLSDTDTGNATTLPATDTGNVTTLPDIDIEALQNLSSMYNSDTGTLNVKNIVATGDVTIGGNTTIGGTTAIKGNTTIGGSTTSTGPVFGDYLAVNYSSTKPTSTYVSGIYDLFKNNKITAALYRSNERNIGLKTYSHLYMSNFGDGNYIKHTGKCFDSYTPSGTDGWKGTTATSMSVPAGREVSMTDDVQSTLCTKL
jgi:hypothetical protein